MKCALPFLSKDRDRHGNERLYVRRAGKHKVRLKHQPGDPEFMAEYQAALAEPDKEPQPKGIKEGTLGWLMNEWEHSHNFQKLGHREARTRHLQLESMLNEETVPGNGLRFRDCPIKSLTRQHVITLRDRKMIKDEKQKLTPKPNAANHRVTQMRVILDWGMNDRAAYVAQNVATDVKLIPIKTDGYHTWTEDEVAQYEKRHLVGTVSRLALDIMLYTGMRRSDATRIGPEHITVLKNPETGVAENWIVFTPKKTSGTTGKVLRLPLLDALKASMNATPHGLKTFMVTGYGKPFTSSNSFGNWFKDRVAQAGLPDFCTAHGLRKAGAVRSAENGATAKQMMAIFGWDSIRMAEHYIKMAEQKKLAGAGMHTLASKS
jgi:integrase